MWTERLFGLAPVGVPPHVFALDRDRMRYARFHPASEGLELRELLTVELEPGLFPDGPLAGAARDAERLGEAVDALLTEADTTIHEASLVLPDQWLRVAFADAADVPPRGPQRDDVIRFKLRRLVPFRVEDLRVSAADAPGLTSEDDEARLILGFASEGLVGQAEEVFGERGVRLGQISNYSLSLLSALSAALGGGDAGVLAHTTADSYCLVVTRRGEPVLHRHKTQPGGKTDRVLVSRDLHLTSRFIGRQMGTRPSQVVFVGPAEAEKDWQGELEKAFEAPVRILRKEWGELPGTVTGVPIHESAVLLGAASRRVT